MFFKKENIIDTYNTLKKQLNIVDKKQEFKLFFQKIKNTITNNKEIRNIIKKYYSKEPITNEDNELLKKIIKDNLKLVGIGSLSILTMPIPGSTLLVLFLIKGAKKFGIDLRPSEFIKENKDSEHIDITKMTQSDWAELQYTVLNDCFPNIKLKILPVKLSSNKSYAAQFAAIYNRTKSSLEKPLFKFNKNIYWTEQKLKNVMAHEIIHYYLCSKGLMKAGHGPYFVSQMNRINRLNNGYKVTLRDDEFNIITTEDDKTTLGGYLIIMRSRKKNFFCVIKDYKNIEKLYSQKFMYHAKMFNIEELLVKELTIAQIKKYHLSINRELKFLSFKDAKFLDELDNETKYITKIKLNN